MREIRLRRKMTQAEVADGSNVAISTISRLEEGHRTPRMLTLYKIADTLGIPFADLVDIQSEYYEEHSDEFLIKEYLKLMRKLDSEEQDQAISMLRMFVSMKRKAGKGKGTSIFDQDP